MKCIRMYVREDADAVGRLSVLVRIWRNTEQGFSMAGQEIESNPGFGGRMQYELLERLLGLSLGRRIAAV